MVGPDVRATTSTIAGSFCPFALAMMSCARSSSQGFLQLGPGGRDEARRERGAAGGLLVSFEDQDVGAALLGSKCRGEAASAGTDDDDGDAVFDFRLASGEDGHGQFLHYYAKITTDFADWKKQTTPTSWAA
jgi:hypothetical protein